MTAKRQYIHPEAAQELVAFQVAAQQAAAHAQAAEVAYRRAATAVAAAMGISKATPKELDQDESGMFFVVETAGETAGETAVLEGA